MAKDHGSSVKDDKQYEGLRKKGMSKQRAAFDRKLTERFNKQGWQEERQGRRRHEVPEARRGARRRKEVQQVELGRPWIVATQKQREPRARTSRKLRPARGEKKTITTSQRHALRARARGREGCGSQARRIDGNRHGASAMTVTEPPGRRRVSGSRDVRRWARRN